MYSTKLLNSRMVDGNKYITVGDPYRDPPRNLFRQGKKGEVLKHFQVKLHPPNAENGNFQKVTYVPSQYKEGNLYITTQPLDKRLKGFGTKDASRRDEFSSEIRCQQYKEGIKKELELTRKFIKAGADTVSSPESPSSAGSMGGTATWRGIREGETHQYDIGRTQVTEFDPKVTRDTYYKLAYNREKNWGTCKPVSADIGDAANSIEYKPPKFGSASLVKNFYDQSHLKVRGVSG